MPAGREGAEVEARHEHGWRSQRCGYHRSLRPRAFCHCYLHYRGGRLLSLLPRHTTRHGVIRSARGSVVRITRLAPDIFPSPAAILIYRCGGGGIEWYFLSVLTTTAVVQRLIAGATRTRPRRFDCARKIVCAHPGHCTGAAANRGTRREIAAGPALFDSIRIPRCGFDGPAALIRKSKRRRPLLFLFFQRSCYRVTPTFSSPFV